MILRTAVRMVAAIVLAMFEVNAGAQTAPAVPTTSPTVYTVKLDPSAPQRIWDGWGVSLCWWANVYGDRDDLADLCFTLKEVELSGEPLPGLGLNIVRYNAGACSKNTVDGQAMAYPPLGPKVPAFRQIDAFWLDSKSTDPSSRSWDWSVDAKQRAMMIKARDRGANYFELFSNSPVWWMCKNFNPSGAAKGADNLAPAHYQNFAIYLSSIALYARDHWGIRFTSIEPFNEPANPWIGEGRQEGCSIPAQVQAKIIPLLRGELNKRGLESIPIAASDDSFYSQAVSTWRSFSPDVRAQVGQFNVHGYQEKPTSPRDAVREQAAGKRLWSSEYGCNEPSGLQMARAIGLDLRLLRPTAWCYWQVCDKPGWALIPADMSNATMLLPANPKLFVLAQYTRHIRPGMTVFTSPDDKTVAAFDVKKHRLALVALNDGPARKAVYDFSSFAEASGPVNRWLTEPKSTARYEESALGNALAAKLLYVDLPADSVQTFEVSGVRVNR